MSKITGYIIVEGWHHPKNGGDDRPFVRGFENPKMLPLERFNEIFKSKFNKKSAIPEDFVSKFVSKKEYDKYFTPAGK